MDINLWPQIFEFIKVASFLGLVICSALIAGLNFKVFKHIFKERAHGLWWLFLMYSIAPLLIMLVIFTFIFEEKSPIKRIIVFKDGHPALNIQEVKATEIKFVKPYEIIRGYIKRKENASEYID